jgi:hypothetical protein
MDGNLQIHPPNQRSGGLRPPAPDRNLLVRFGAFRGASGVDLHQIAPILSGGEALKLTGTAVRRPAGRVAKG